MKEIPEFVVGLDDIWGNITDEEIIATIVELEAENESKTRQASPALYEPVQPPTSTSSRFASLTERELSQLEFDRHKKKMMEMTAWASRLIRGEIVHK